MDRVSRESFLDDHASQVDAEAGQLNLRINRVNYIALGPDLQTILQSLHIVAMNPRTPIGQVVVDNAQASGPTASEDMNRSRDFDNPDQRMSGMVRNPRVNFFEFLHRECGVRLVLVQPQEHLIEL